MVGATPYRGSACRAERFLVIAVSAGRGRLNDYPAHERAVWQLAVRPAARHYLIGLQLDGRSDQRWFYLGTYSAVFVDCARGRLCAAGAGRPYIAKAAARADPVLFATGGDRNFFDQAGARPVTTGVPLVVCPFPRLFAFPRSVKVLFAHGLGLHGTHRPGAHDHPA